MLRRGTLALGIAAVALAGITSFPLLIFMLAAGWWFVSELTESRAAIRPRAEQPDQVRRHRALILRNRVASRLLDADPTMSESRIVGVRERYHDASRLYIRASARLDRTEAAVADAAADFTEADWQLDCAEAILMGLPMPHRPVLLEQPHAPEAPTVCPDCLEARCYRALATA